MTSLEELLNGNSAAPQTQASEPQDSPQPGEAEKPDASTERPHEGAPQPNAGQQTGEQNGATPAPAQQPQTEEQVKAFQKAAEDERRKRQNLEREINELRAWREEVQRQQQQRPQQQPQPAPQFLDPEAVQYLQQQFTEQLQQERTQLQQDFLVTKVTQSQELMRARHTDYDQVEQIFADAMARDPSLREQMWSHPVPAQFAYQVGKKIQALDEIGSDPAAYREKMKAEILAELQASQAAQQQNTLSQQPAPNPAAPPPPPSLAGVPSATGQRAQAYQGPTPLDDLLSQPINRRR